MIVAILKTNLTERKLMSQASFIVNIYKILLSRSQLNSFFKVHLVKLWINPYSPVNFFIFSFLKLKRLNITDKKQRINAAKTK